MKPFSQSADTSKSSGEKKQLKTTNMDSKGNKVPSISQIDVELKRVKRMTRQEVAAAAAQAVAEAEAAIAVAEAAARVAEQAEAAAEAAQLFAEAAMSALQFMNTLNENTPN